MSQRSLHQGRLPAASNRSFHSEAAMKMLPSRTKSAANQASFVLGITLAAAVLTVSAVADWLFVRHWRMQRRRPRSGLLHLNGLPRCKQA
jgi:hypothetical protein